MPSKLEKLIAAKKRLESPPVDVLSAAFPQQLKIIKDPARRKAVFVSRRSGKSYMIGIYLLYVALNNPAVKCLYFGKTKDAAENVMYMHILYHLLESFGLKQGIDYKWHKNNKTITFSNQSVITLTGADATEHQIEKVLGGKYKLVIFDECQVIKHDLERWIKDRLGPAMVDEQGTIMMSGTAGDYMGEAFWYKVTKTDGAPEPGWSVHRWKWFDNVHMKDLIEKELNELKSLTPGIEDTPGFRQEWLCEWVIDRSGRIYKYDPAKNSLDDQEKIDFILKDKEWKFIIGMDFGYEDDTALVVGAFSKYDPVCYIVDSFKRPKMITQEVAETILAWREKYNPVFIVGDAQNKTLIETLRMQYRIPIVPAKKLGKESHIAAMNSDFLTARIKVIERNNGPLIKEWNDLTWSETKRMLGLYKENPTKDNHLADAALYLHHFSKHYRAIERPKEDDSISPFRKIAEKQYQSSQSAAHTSIYDQMDNMIYAEQYRENR